MITPRDIAQKRAPVRKPLLDTDLLRLVDAAIFGEGLTKLTPHEITEARKSQVYSMLRRLGTAMYRAGEQGLRPRPSLMVVENGPRADAAPATDEQPDPLATAP